MSGRFPSTRGISTECWSAIGIAPPESEVEGSEGRHPLHRGFHGSLPDTFVRDSLAGFNSVASAWGGAALDRQDLHITRGLLSGCWRE